MDADANHKERLNNLPPELLNIIFGYSDSTDLAKNRVVCAYWRNIIESTQTTSLEMDNNNWETFVKKSTALKIHLKLINVQFPIYLAPEFCDFMSRVNILEITGHIPEYNVINILNECRKVHSLTIDRVKLDSLRRLDKFNLEANEVNLDLKQLKVGYARRHLKHTQDLLLVTDYAGALLKSNCLSELNVSSVLDARNVFKFMYSGVFEEEPLDQLKDKVLQRILNRQRQSLRLIRFCYRIHDEVPGAPPQFIKFHPYDDAADINPANHNLQIFDSCLHVFRHNEYRGLLLKIFETQFKMRNLDIYFSDQADLDQVENIIKNNSATLEEITLGSIENMQDTYRSLSCACFGPCFTLKQLTLQTGSRKVKLVDLLLLPTSLEKLSLTGFIPTGSSELFGKVTEPSQFPNLAEVMLGKLPWFIQDEKPVTTFETTHLLGFLNVFPKIRKLTLMCIPPDRLMVVREANAIGMERPPHPVSPAFVTWCRQGGGDNVEITSIQIVGDNGIDGNQLLGYGVFGNGKMVHEICIGNAQH